MKLRQSFRYIAKLQNVLSWLKLVLPIDVGLLFFAEEVLQLHEIF